MFLDKYSKIIEKIEYYSNETLNSMIKNYENVILKDFYKDIVSVMGAGKKLRPLSMIFAFNGIKNEINEEIIKVSVSCELVHNASLILDDAMDEDVMRRGKKTFNSIYADKFLRSVGFNFSSYESGQSWIEKDSILGIIEMQRNISRFSYALSVLASNVLYELSEEVLNSQFPKKLRIKVLEQHRKMYLRLNEGQLLDILMEKRKMSEKVESDLEKMNKDRRRAEEEYLKSQEGVLEVKRIQREGIQSPEDLLMYITAVIEDAKHSEDMARIGN
ncbi:MAG: polyprenyl synthetase family protein, partial [Methanomicrobia archaeon]|nr:polyprenyl synthetase family protein [Methanomicrobia archaeon]